MKVVPGPSGPLASILAAALLALSGCGSGGGNDSGSSVTASETTENTEGTTATGSGGVESTGGVGPETGTGDTGAPGCEPPGDTGAGAPMLACDELPGSCGDCIWEKCCELSDLCTVDADCACMTMCISTQSVAGTVGCLDTCGLAGSPPGFSDLLSCAASACSNAGGVGGECSVPAGFEPPPDAEPPPPMSDDGIGSGMLADCSFGPPDPTGSVLQLQSADASVCVRIERRDDGPGSLANTSWTLLNMRVGPLGEVALIDDPTQLCWYSSHHNFNDWAHAWSGTRYYEVRASFAGHSTPQTFELHVYEQPPIGAASCAPKSDGICPIATMDLFAAP